MYYAILILAVDIVIIVWVCTVYCYAGDIDLLSPTLSGLKELLNLCEDYALKHKIIVMPLKVNFFISHQAQPVCQRILC